ncbi:MAG: CdvA-like protein [Desulfurococcales archaeon]|nr:CdvA-like protein [Desulfurococcales archaeon]
MKIEEVAGSIGRVVFDEYGREIGILVSVSADAEGYVEYVEIKVEDLRLEKVEGERVKITDGKLTVVPEWKHAAIKLIDSLDRSYKRKKGVEEMIAKGEIPGEVLKELERKLTEQIKKLKMKAKEVEAEIKKRIEKIDYQNMHIARAMAVLQMTYFSGEVGERQFEQGMTHLKKLKETLTKEKEEAKEILDKLSKTLELASGSKITVKTPAKKHEAPKTTNVPEAFTVKVVDG